MKEIVMKSTKEKEGNAEEKKGQKNVCVNKNLLINKIKTKREIMKIFKTSCYFDYDEYKFPADMQQK